MEWGNLTAVGTLDPEMSRSKVEALLMAKVTVGVVILIESKQESESTLIDLWHWLVDHAVPRR